MPDGRTHDELTLVVGAFLAPISYGLLFGDDVARTAVFIGSHVVSGLLFSDDLDTHSIEYRRWRLLGPLWWPYQKLIPHRSWLSHGPIIGPALRILYFAALCSLIAWLLLLAVGLVAPVNAGGLVVGGLAGVVRFLAAHPEWTTIAFAGFALGGLTHSVADWLWSFWRRAWRAPVIRAVGPRTPMPLHHSFPAADFLDGAQPGYAARERFAPRAEAAAPDAMGATISGASPQPADEPLELPALKAAIPDAPQVDGAAGMTTEDEDAQGR